MRELSIESYGKVNLALDVLYKRNDGYHEINSIMQQISLKDQIIFKDRKEGILLTSSSKELLLDSTNLVYRAWEKMKALTGINRGISINIEKNIPIAAGLAGGSSNGAITLKAINTLWDLKLSQKELMDIGKSLGADLPFCIIGGTVQAQGIGEIITPLKPFKDKFILIGNPGIGISTAYAYSKLDLGKARYDIEALIKAMDKEDLSAVASLIKNKMEAVIIMENPIIGEIKKAMIKYGALGSLMSGSGPTVFGLFDDKDKMVFAHKKLSGHVKKLYCCTTI